MFGGVSFEGLLGLPSVDDRDAVNDGWKEVGCVAFPPPGLCGVEQFVGHCHAGGGGTGSFGYACSEVNIGGVGSTGLVVLTRAQHWSETHEIRHHYVNIATP